MNRKETGEIRRQLDPEQCTSDCIRGYYINEKREIISGFELPLATFPEDEKAKYLNVFKRVLTGTIGKKLINVDFTTKQTESGREQKLLYEMRKSISGESEYLKEFTDRAVKGIPGDEKCVMLLMHQAYDVPARSKSADSDEVFNFIICAVCPVKEKDAGLCYEFESRIFRTKAKEQTIGTPDFGFMYPRFDDRCSNIYGALYYSKKASGQNSFTDAVFNAPLPMPAEQQKDTFGNVLCASVGEECTFELVQSVRDHISEVIETYKNDKFADEAPVITKSEICDLLRGNEIADEHIEAFCEEYDESFGKGTALTPENLMDIKRIELKTPDVTVKAAADKQDLIRVEKIDGVKYILIRADDGVECNGINIKIK